MTGVTAGLRALLSRLSCFVVDEFGSTSGGDMSTVERETGDLGRAHVVSSHLRFDSDRDDALDEFFGPDLHMIVIDVDHPAHLVESSTPGHHHLYVEIPPVRWADYAAWLEASAKIGLLEDGYVAASLRRGHSDVRLPWIHKGDVPFGRDQTGDKVLLHCFRCQRRPHQIPEYVAETRRASLEATDSQVISGADVDEWVRGNEGTVNGVRFACTDCYIAIGMPTLPGGWKPWADVAPGDPVQVPQPLPPVQVPAEPF